jgi:hypothetical protein
MTWFWPLGEKETSACNMYSNSTMQLLIMDHLKLSRPPLWQFLSLIHVYKFVEVGAGKAQYNLRVIKFDSI